MRFISIFILTFALLATTQAQIVVSGTVADESGVTFPGVNVVVKGTYTGQITDANGRYSISVPDENAVLVFSFIGYATREFLVGNQRTINVTLTEDTQQLEEIVVVGYGTQRKSDVTGSISIATSEDLLRVPSYSAITGLKGIASGVNVYINSGMPGGNTRDRVVIRGYSSINAQQGQPLYVVDGVVTEDFAFINPNEIERMEVLKDASSAAIYGARGAMGVILVTTKRGAKGETSSITYSGYVSVKTMGRKMETLNAAEYMQAYKIGMQNAVKYGTSTEAQMNTRWANISRNSPLNPDYFDLFRINGTFNPEGWKNLNDNTLEPLYDTFWQDEATRNAISHSHNLNIQQGSKNSSTGITMNYLDDQGLMVNTYFKRVSARITNDAKLKDWLSSSTSVGVSHSRQRDTPESGGLDAARMLIEMPAIFPVKYPTGEWSNTNSGLYGFGFEAGPNPVHYLNAREEIRNRTALSLNSALTFHLAEGLDLKTQFGINGNLQHRTRHYPAGVINQDNSGKGQVELDRDEVLFWQESTTLNYSKVMENHRFSAMVGAEWSERIYFRTKNNVGNFATNAFGIYNIQSGTEPYEQQSEHQRWGMNSYFGRFAYTFSDKYMATVTARMDGSSRVGENNKFGFFPSAGLGWMISNEDFLSGITWLDQLKLHTSYGVTGNSEIPVYRSLAVYGTGTVLVDGARATSGWPSRLANPDLRWEKQSMWDIGFNLNTFRNRLNFDISYYYKYTSDLCLDAPIPQSSGYSSIYKNAGAISNRGLDAMITGVIVSSNDFDWSATLNANYNANKVEKLNDGNADIFVGDNWVGARVLMRVGEPMAQFYGLERIGIKDAEYVAKYGGRVGTALRSPDLKTLGKGNPDWTGSLINRFRYKQFDFQADLQFVIGGKIRQDFHHSTEDRFGLTSGLRTILTEAWNEDKPANKPNQVQAIRIGSFDGQDSNFDTRWLCDASYLRGNLFQLAYNFTPQMASSIGVNAVRAYVSVENAFVLVSKDFRGFDPEGSTRGQFEPNTFFFSYPKPRTFSLGLNITF